MNPLKKIAKIALGAAIGYVLIALALIFSQPVGPVIAPEGESLNFTSLYDLDLGEEAPLQSIPARDGTDLPYRSFGLEDADMLAILIHGSGAHGQPYQPLARQIAEQAHARVLLPDLRGHGITPERRGDIDYIGQFEDDLADLIEAHRQPGQRLVMAGHSSGGGLTIRFAGGEYGALLDAAILMAPFIHHTSPTQRQDSGGWAQVAVRRIIGISMLDGIGVTSFNALPIIAFAFPVAVLDSPVGDTMARMYSFRLNTSFAPRGDYAADLAKLPTTQVITCEHDEAFVAAAFEPLIAPLIADSRFDVLPGVGHLDLIHNTEAARIAAEFVAGLR